MIEKKREAMKTIALIVVLILPTIFCRAVRLITRYKLRQV